MPRGVAAVGSAPEENLQVEEVVDDDLMWGAICGVGLRTGTALQLVCCKSRYDVLPTSNCFSSSLLPQLRVMPMSGLYRDASDVAP